MRPVSIISATFYGILLILASAIAGVAAQDNDAFAGVGGMASSLTSSPQVTAGAPTTSTGGGTAAVATGAAMIDYYAECLVVFGPEGSLPGCLSSCRTKGVELAAVQDTASCTRRAISESSTLVQYTNLDSLVTSTVVTVASGNPVYVSTVPTHEGQDTTLYLTRTRFVSPTLLIGSPTSTALDQRPAASSTSGASGAAATSSNLISSTAKKSNTGAIAGGVVGGILGLLLIVAAVFFIRRRRRRRNESKPHDAFSSLEKSRGISSPHSPPPQIPITSYDSPSPAPQQQQQSHPESQHSLMGAYSPPGGVVPAKHHTEVEVDEDGVSLRSPSPPLGEDMSRGRDYVPRLPIYNRGSDETPRGSAL